VFGQEDSLGWQTAPQTPSDEGGTAIAGLKPRAG
jgi:hypothetical protein